MRDDAELLGGRISIHALREEGDLPGCGAGHVDVDFYPRPPRGGRRVFHRPARAARPISIHALREEGDCLCHAPCEGAHLFLSTPSARRATYFFSKPIDIYALFLSTPSARRATVPHVGKSGNVLISIHALREEGDVPPPRVSRPSPISIHALREEGDNLSCISSIAFKLFLSTPSARRATWLTLISRSTAENFYPRPPRGGRRADACASDVYGKISIHALREEGDLHLRVLRRHFFRFLSTPSARRATARPQYNDIQGVISIHALREEGDQGRSPALQSQIYFYPRPPRGGRLMFLHLPSGRDRHFYPRPPRGGRPPP